MPIAFNPDPVAAEEMSSRGNSALSATDKVLANLPARIPQLDGLRGIAIGLVLIFHFFLVPAVYAPGTLIAYALVSGRLFWTGVDLFFVLSGFLIGGILLDGREATNYFQVFYIRRFFRIVPIYFLCFGGVYILNLLSGNGSNQNASWLFEDHLPWATFPFFIQNFWMAARNSLGSFGLGATWSLAVEEQFYLTVPVLARVLMSYVSLLLYAVLFPYSFVGRALCAGWLRWLGAIAYGTYLFHEFVYGAIYWALYSRPPKVANGQDVFVSALALAASLFICRILWLKFEKPLIAIGHRYHFSSRVASSTVGEAAVKP